MHRYRRRRRDCVGVRASAAVAIRPEASASPASRVELLQLVVADELGEVGLADHDVGGSPLGGTNLQLNEVGHGLEASQLIDRCIEDLAFRNIGVQLDHDGYDLVVRQVITGEVAGANLLIPDDNHLPSF